MGRLKFAGEIRLDLDDRTLAHVHRAILIKLRRGESFHLSWRDDSSIGDGRTTIWISPDTSMACSFTGAPVMIDADWVERLVVASNSLAGMTPIPDPAPARR